jgi:tripartite-type tricarboxylate transporter receptor subunit TctC
VLTHLILKTGLAAALIGGTAAAAAAFPDRPVRLVVGYPPGGATDIVARVLARELGRKWGRASRCRAPRPTATPC